MSIRQYLLTVMTAAVICAAVRALTQNKSTASGIINLLTSVFLILAVISPLQNWSYINIKNQIADYSVQADTLSNMGVKAAQLETLAFIKKQTEAYIVEKAASLGVVLEAEITLGEDVSGMAESVILTANTSPYMKQRITQFISTDLGIPEAQQTWN